MKSKKEAEETEAKLLDTFDYAWNKGSNVIRRPDEILKKLDEIASSTGRFSSLYRIFVPLTQKKVGIKIKGDKLLLQKNKVSADADEESNNFLSGVIKFSRSRPQLVSGKRETDVTPSNTCGVLLSDGTSCTLPPVLGRKRCEEHKGRKIYGYSFKLITEGKSPSSPDLCMNSSTLHGQDSHVICGVALGNGTSCGRKPIVGRKRCEEHKGMKINALISKSAKNKSGVNLGGCASDNELHNDPASKSMLFSDRCSTDRDPKTVCGAALRNGSFCTRSLTKGHERCWQHRVNGCDSSFSCSLKSDSQSRSVICGVTSPGGSVCEKSPAGGRKRCEQHKGMRLIVSQ